ncbi:MAG: fadB2 [Acidimicrobiaceae bacterium]|jgi:3-hydroxybutyryl-CoA dehydrogenase|nr:fadB2 [Acidimicrobiaceae bacterium]
MADIERVGVVGCGLMGSGIAEVCARAALDVVVAEADDAALQLGRARIEQSLARALRAGKISDRDVARTRDRLRFTTDLADFADCQLVVEAVAEREELKAQVFATLDVVVEDRAAILASNTSSIPIARLGAATGRPGQVLGLHFFNPVPVMALVEITRSLDTDEATLERAESFVRTVLAKDVVRSKDRAGFIVNTLLVPYLLGAIRMFESGAASAADIDLAMRAGCAHPMGPLTLADFIGLDTLKSIADVLYEEYKDGAFVVPALLSRMVDAGRLGKKTGRGFHSYE